MLHAVLSCKYIFNQKVKKLYIYIYLNLSFYTDSNAKIEPLKFIPAK